MGVGTEQDTATLNSAFKVPDPAHYSAVQLGKFTEAQVAGIEARITHGALPWWRRWREPRPPTWAQTTT